jgi:exopolysaccharide biosynthesis polyprenyl glycosylphosphotransferase
VTLLLFAADIGLTIGALYLADTLRHQLPFGFGDSEQLAWISWRHFLAVAGIWAFLLYVFNVYEPRRMFTVVDEIRMLVPAVSVAFVLLFAYFFLAKVEYLSRLLFAYFYLLDLLFLVNLRWVLRLAMRSSFGLGLARPLIIAGAGPVGRQIAGLLRNRPWTGYKIVGFLDDNAELVGTEVDGITVLGQCDELADVIEHVQVAEVIVALPSRSYDRIRQIVMVCQTLPVRIRVVPDLFNLVSVRARAEDLWGIPLIGIREPVIAGFDSFVKRMFDVVLGSIAAAVLAPAMLFAALALIVLEGGPVMFRQQRVGENGRLFWIYKFRTMKVPPEDQSHEDVEAYKRADDPRVTTVGRLLRRTSLDELPQLWNVLRGEMSLVGPRPELPWVVEKYETWQRQRLSVPPGMTGWWQIQGRGDRPLNENVEYDLFYIQNYSPLLDITILWKTIWVVVMGKGAY